MDKPDIFTSAPLKLRIRKLLEPLTTAVSVKGNKPSLLPQTMFFTKGAEAYHEGKNEEALQWLNKELDSDPDNAYAMLYIAKIYHDKGEYQKALPINNQAILKLPKKDSEYRAIAYDNRASVYQATGNPINAQKDLNKAIDLNPWEATYYQHRASLYMNQHKFKLAEKDYKTMLYLDPNNIEGYIGLASAHMCLDKYYKAIAEYNAIVEHAPDYPRAYTFRSNCYMRLSMYPEAIEDFIKGLSLSKGILEEDMSFLIENIPPQHIPILINKLIREFKMNSDSCTWPYYLGQVHEYIGNYKKAAEYYRVVYDRSAELAALINQGNCLALLGRYDDAFKCIDRAIDSDPEKPSSLLITKGKFLFESGRYTEALAEFDHYLSHFTDNYYSYYYRGLTKQAISDLDGAIADYTKAIALEPEVTYLYYRRGQCFDKQSEQHLAKTDFGKVIELCKTNNISSTTAPSALLYLGYKKEASILMDEMIRKQSDNAQIFYEGACFYTLVGENDKAMDYLIQAFDHGFRNITLMNNEPELASLRNLPAYVALISKYSEG